MESAMGAPRTIDELLRNAAAAGMRVIRRSRIDRYVVHPRVIHSLRWPGVDRLTTRSSAPVNRHHSVSGRGWCFAREDWGDAGLCEICSQLQRTKYIGSAPGEEDQMRQAMKKLCLAAAPALNGAVRCIASSVRCGGKRGKLV